MIIAGTILSFTSAVSLSTQSTQFVNPWGTEDMLGVGIGMRDPDNEIGYYGAYEACEIDGEDLKICDELQHLFDEHTRLLDN